MRRVMGKYIKMKHNTKTLMDLVLILLIMLFAKFYYSRTPILQSNFIENRVKYSLNLKVYKSSEDAIINIEIINQDKKIKQIKIEEIEINIYANEKLIYNKKESDVKEFSLKRKGKKSLKYIIEISNLDYYRDKELILEYQFKQGQLRKKIEVE